MFKQLKSQVPLSNVKAIVLLRRTMAVINTFEWALHFFSVVHTILVMFHIILVLSKLYNFSFNFSLPVLPLQVSYHILLECLHYLT